VFGQGAGLPGIKGNVSNLYDGYNKDLKKRAEQALGEAGVQA
jgi:hypothetical protein